MTFPCKLEHVRDEDFVEYFLFPKLKETNGASASCLLELDELLVNVNQLIKRFQKDYIWHKDVIKLTPRTSSSEILDEEDRDEKAPLPPHLYGISHYGENIQDEWFIVHLLTEITKEIPDLVCKIVDSDGEFLLIEAAEHLPQWANPESCKNRVFIVDGLLQLVQNSPSNNNSTLPVEQSLAKIWETPKLYKVSKVIQKCIDEKLEKLLEEIEGGFHRQVIRVPLSIACILDNHPDLIAPAVRSFCERDPIDLKVIKAMKYFPPEEDQVRCSVRFTKCLYAMLHSSKYLPDKHVGWKLPKDVNSEEYKEALLGLKVSSGFEILVVQGKEVNDNYEDDKNWKVYLKNLQGKGYFSENIEGSFEYNRLKTEAQNFYKDNLERFRTSSQVGKSITNYMKDFLNDSTKQELRDKQNNVLVSDSDNWMNITEQELDDMLAKKYGAHKLLSANGEINTKEFTENITEFLDRKSEFDGIEEQESRPSPKVKKNASMRKATNPDNSINFDADMFATHVKSLLDFAIPEDKWESSELSDFSDDDDLECKLGNLNTSGMKKYMDQMDEELAKTTIGKSFERKDADQSLSDDDFEDIESFKPIDIDANAVKNMMDSYKSQFGGPGPATNFLNSMKPKEKDNSSTGEEQSESLSETTV